MYLIVGLGNPGRQYADTRHNAGFHVIDVLAGAENIRVSEKKHRALIGKGMIGQERVILAKPQTYMNLSGECVRELLDYYKVDEREKLVVISDDINLPPGRIRLRARGSAGGHNGLKNIIAHLGHDEFMRVRIGVGEKPAGYDLADHVLGHFSKEERTVMEDAIQNAADAVRTVLNEGLEKAMNRFNAKDC